MLRALDLGKGLDPDRVQGTEQASAIGSHSHSGATNAAGSHSHGVMFNGLMVGPTSAYRVGLVDGGGLQYTSGVPGSATISASGSHSHTFDTAAVGGPETRMANLAELCIIKY